eukprot:GHVT01030118.1.p2 GENE.GHVT01030118.1~~GHVT01030118.1.p2  ORF type:complete len:126 (+),score=1.44 GHVT01030118.1:1634-2011(+)
MRKKKRLQAESKNRHPLTNFWIRTRKMRQLESRIAPLGLREPKIQWGVPLCSRNLFTTVNSFVKQISKTMIGSTFNSQTTFGVIYGSQPKCPRSFRTAEIETNFAERYFDFAESEIFLAAKRTSP